MSKVIYRQLGLCLYADTFEKMREFTHQRDPQTNDEIWFLQHHPVFTQGTSCKTMPFVKSTIPVVASDRGGQITYHGPGQLIVYFLLDIRRRAIGPKSLVAQVEQIVLDFLATLNIDAERKKGAPGVYVQDEKIAALGFRIRNGCSYHGLSLNVEMDLTPFSHIHPCGYEGQRVTQICQLRPELEATEVMRQFSVLIQRRFDSSLAV